MQVKHLIQPPCAHASCRHGEIKMLPRSKGWWILPKACTIAAFFRWVPCDFPFFTHMSACMHMIKCWVLTQLAFQMISLLRRVKLVSSFLHVSPQIGRPWPHAHASIWVLNRLSQTDHCNKHLWLIIHPRNRYPACLPEVLSCKELIIAISMVHNVSNVNNTRK